jgi:TPR repeat protein
MGISPEFALSREQADRINRFSLLAPENLSVSVEACKSIADAGDATAQHEYGMYLAYGIGVEKDLRLAAHYFQLSALQNNSLGACSYGLCLEQGLGIEIDLGRAARFYQISGDQGNAVAHYRYGLCFEYEPSGSLL